MDIERRGENAPWRYPLLISIFVLNVILPSLLLSYGVILLHSVEYGVPISVVFATPTTCIVVYCLTQCWCREITESWGINGSGCRSLAASGVIISATGVLLCAFSPYYLHPFLYGGIGGFGYSILSAEIDSIIFDVYDTRLGIVRGICFTGQAFGQFVFPHILSLIFETYGIAMAYLILSGIVIQTLPAVMFLKVDDKIRRPISFCRYRNISKTYAIFNDEKTDSYFTNEVQLHSFNKKFWKSPSDNNVQKKSSLEVNTEEDDLYAVTVTPPSSPDEKKRNIFGVEILPEIPEENEDSDVEDYMTDKSCSIRRLSAAIKRLSILGDNLDEYITKQTLSGSIIDYDCENKEYSKINMFDNGRHMSESLSDINFRTRMRHMITYKLHRAKRKTQCAFYRFKDTFILPLKTSLFCWRFYPALILCFAKLSLTATFLALLPLISLEIQPKVSLMETNFLMSLHAFTWLSFLLTTPWIAEISKRNFKYVVLFGLSVSMAASFLVAESNDHDSYSIGCIVAGFGYGAITSCWETTAQEFIGPRKWPKVHSSLETLSGVTLGLFYIGLRFLLQKNNGLQLCFRTMGIILGVATLIWLNISIVTLWKTKIKPALSKYRQKK